MRMNQSVYNFKKHISIILLASLTLSSQLQASNKQSRPNILIVIADDASCDTFGAYGKEKGITYAKTPHFDKLAEKGVRFTNAYNCNPKCAPARMCLLTGRYSWQLGPAANHRPILKDQYWFYPFLLEQAGYVAGYTGKGWSPGNYKGVQHKNPAGPVFNERILTPPYTGIKNFDYAGNFKGFLDERDQSKPFCFWLGTSEPHRSYEKDSYKKKGKTLDNVKVQKFYPDNDVIRGDLADYAVEVEYFDTQIGKSIELLKKNGLMDNTLIIVTSDHGMPFPRVKGQIYDEAFRVPFIVYWKGKVKPGTVVSDFITFPDVAPTLMEATGLSVHKQMTGKSFLDLLLAKKSGRIDKTRDHTLIGKERHDIGRTDGDMLTVGYPIRGLRDDHFLYVHNFIPHRWPAGDPEYGYKNSDNGPTKSYIIQNKDNEEGRKYFEMIFEKRPSEELYDIANDPDCVNNLATNKKYAKIKAKMWEQLNEELTQQEDPRILGKGEIFDYYPEAHLGKQKLLYKEKYYDPIERFKEKYGDKEDTKGKY